MGTILGRARQKHPTCGGKTLQSLANAGLVPKKTLQTYKKLGLVRDDTEVTSGDESGPDDSAVKAGSDINTHSDDITDSDTEMNTGSDMSADSGTMIGSDSDMSADSGTIIGSDSDMNSASDSNGDSDTTLGNHRQVYGGKTVQSLAGLIPEETLQIYKEHGIVRDEARLDSDEDADMNTDSGAYPDQGHVTPQVEPSNGMNPTPKGL